MINLNQESAERLSTELRRLSLGDKGFFHPHEFDIESVRNIIKEEGNHYYIYLDGSGDFAGYGMLRTFGKYKAPTLGCVIWQEYRGRGNGKQLVQELISKAVELKCKKIRLKVHRGNRIAYEVYRKVGFAETGASEGELTWMEYGGNNDGHV